jgi:hypothetical protein
MIEAGSQGDCVSNEPLHPVGYPNPWREDETDLAICPDIGRVNYLESRGSNGG